jgi:DNA end-binding protein Ku
MAALNASVQAAKESRGESGEHATVDDMPKKTTPKKAPAQEGRRTQTPQRTTAAIRQPYR